jgi:hypothetical protein
MNEAKLERHVREAQRKYADLESRMKEDMMMARIRDAENTQCVAELTQKISSLEYKVHHNIAESLGGIIINQLRSSLLCVESGDDHGG